MSLKKSTKYHLIVLAASFVVAVLLHATQENPGCLAAIAVAIACSEGLLFVAKGIVTLFRLVVRRIDLRLAFSYFLIGVVPIPLLAALLFAVAYILAIQFLGTRVKHEVSSVVEIEAISDESLPEIRVENHQIAESSVDWLKSGDRADWADAIDSPKSIVQNGTVWFVARRGEGKPGRLALLSFADPSVALLQRLADRTGYEVRVFAGEGESRKTGYVIHKGEASKEWERAARPRNARPPGKGLIEREWLVGLWVDRPAAILGAKPEQQREIVGFLARTSPRVFIDQLFAQGVPEIGRVFWAVVVGLAMALLLVYLVALTIAFFLIASIARNINRLTRSTQAIARGDFSVRVQSKARDQIGDLARSFDGMAASIQKLLVETAEKKKLEGEIAVARTIQQKLLPPAEAELSGVQVLAHFQPVAEIGGDYYDYLSMPDERTAVAVGDVSGHGLSTGLLVAMAKAALTTQIESGLTGSALFTRLNDLMYRSTDSRNYMTLSLFAYDARTHRGELTNAGQLAPYRFSEGEVSSLSLPSFPLGTSATAVFPTASYDLAPGDRLLFLTDGLVEAANSAGDPFGFERLEALLKADASADAQRLKETLLAAVLEHTGGAAADDDRTLVILTLT